MLLQYSTKYVITQIVITKSVNTNNVLWKGGGDDECY